LTFSAGNGVGANFTQNFNLTVDQDPAITSANNSTFVVGNPGSFLVTASGFPNVVVSESGALPSGVTFDAATGILSGTSAAGSTGTYPLTFTASNGVGANAIQNFILTIGQTAAITSASSAVFTVGSVGSFTVVATGFPSAFFEESGALPEGVSFNGATGILSGTPPPGAGGSYDLMFTANNGVGAGNTQNFKLTVNQAPAITNLDNTAFNTGTASSITLAVSGFPTPQVTEGGALPGGISFNSATGVLSGTPAEGAGGAYSLTFTAENGIGTPAVLHVVVSVHQPLAISSPAQTTFSPGRPNSFAVSASGFPTPLVVEIGTLPVGVTFASGVLSGSPQIGTEGSYALTLIAENGVEAEVAQNFKLVVQETANQRYVTTVYEDLLGQAPDREGLAYWSGLLDLGDSRAAVLGLFDHGIWYFSPLIESAYQKYLGRTPDSGGQVFWTQQMINGVTDEQLDASLIASTEYYQHASGSDKGWVDALYQELLGRQPDAVGELFWTQQMAKGTSRFAVAYSVAASSERQRQNIAADYEKFLGRAAGSTEIDYWLGQFSKGVTNEDIITGMLASDEYYKKER
jgi:hypothetical protein